MLLYVSLSLFLPFFSPSPCSLSFCHVSRKQPGENCPRFSDSLIIRRCGYVGKGEGVVGAGDLRRGFFFFLLKNAKENYRREREGLEYKSKI